MNLRCSGASTWILPLRSCVCRNSSSARGRGVHDADVRGIESVAVQDDREVCVDVVALDHVSAREAHHVLALTAAGSIAVGPVNRTNRGAGVDRYRRRERRDRVRRRIRRRRRWGRRRRLRRRRRSGLGRRGRRRRGRRVGGRRRLSRRQRRDGFVGVLLAAREQHSELQNQERNKTRREPAANRPSGRAPAMLYLPSGGPCRAGPDGCRRRCRTSPVVCQGFRDLPLLPPARSTCARPGSSLGFLFARRFLRTESAAAHFSSALTGA